MMDYPALLATFPLLEAKGEGWRIGYRSSGQAPRVSHVLLHGIGSASANWLEQLRAAEGRDDLRVLAWDAPGYGESTLLSDASPVAQDYGARLWAWLDALGETGPVVLVGHSLGTLMASAAFRLQPGRVKRLILLSPARGYGAATEEVRNKVLETRLGNLEKLGPAGMAQARASAMLSAQASAPLIAFVANSMAQIVPAGYRQAVRLLVFSDLSSILRACSEATARMVSLVVASGSEDQVTPRAACEEVAANAGVPWQDLGPVGHACALEAGPAVNELIGLAPRSIPTRL